MTTISKSSEIKSILSKGKKFIFRNFIVICNKNQLGYLRYAVVVSKKVSKRAVDRNRAKRLLKELIRKHEGILKELDGLDLIFIGRREILSKKLFELYPEFNELIVKLKDDCKNNNRTY